jgi:hypothetical protein
MKIHILKICYFGYFHDTYHFEPFVNAISIIHELFELFDSACQLVWAGSAACLTLDALQPTDEFIGVHALNERGDTFEIAVTAILKRHVVDAVIPYIKVDFT